MMALLLGTLVNRFALRVPCHDTGEEQCSPTFVDALYLTIVTISTVGYGDIAPTSAALRIFTVFYILIGAGYVFVRLADVFSVVLDSFSANRLDPDILLGGLGAAGVSRVDHAAWFDQQHVAFSGCDGLVFHPLRDNKHLLCPEGH